MQIVNRRAFVSGSLFLVIAVAFLLASLPYDPGTSANMGPGYFPRMLSLCLGALGLMILVRAMRPGAGREAIERFAFGPLFWIAGSVALFALILPYAGLAIAISVMVIATSVASRETTVIGAATTAFVLTALSILIFVGGIGLRVPLWPTFL